MVLPPARSEHVAIDGDVIRYSVGFAAEQKDDEGNITPEPVEYALSTVRSMIRSIVKACGAKTYTVFLTGGGNFREDIATITPYKGNRVDQRKPYHYTNIGDYLMEHHNGVIVEGEEADDVLGRLCKQGDTIATIDKDLNNVPGWHYNWNKDELYYVTEEEAHNHFYIQMLTGDSTDNIPGLYKMTGVKASAKYKALIRKARTPYRKWLVVRGIWKRSYLSNGICPDEVDEVIDKWLLEIGRLLWISHEDNELWTPPSI